jgi:ABC-type molybdate transport system permease subunit
MDLSPIWLTLKLAAIATLILLLIGLPLAWWLSKKRSLIKTIIEAIITMPLVLPPSVLGFYLLLAFSPQHGLGHWLQQTFDVLMIGGNIPGVTRVASIAVYDSVEQMNYTAANNYSLILFAITFVMVLSVFIYNKYQAKSPLE